MLPSRGASLKGLAVEGSTSTGEGTSGERVSTILSEGSVGDARRARLSCRAMFATLHDISIRPVTQQSTRI